MWITTGEAARILGMNTDYFHRHYIAKNRVVFKRLRGQIVIRKDSLLGK